MLLLTTPDYLPKLGGLTSHTLNVEKVLKELGVEYELFQWNSYLDIIRYPKTKLAKFDYILNIHSGFNMFMPSNDAKVINFVNGAEMLFYSPSPMKKFVKVLTRKFGLRRMAHAYVNIFISEFTFKKTCSKGLRGDYSRDIIFPMMVDTSHHKLNLKSLNDPLKFICVARDVPHKNFAGAIYFCELLQEISGRPVEFITVTNKKFESSKIAIRSVINPSNEQRDKLLAEAHINLLFSLDHSHVGFFEGFGQIVQEAGCLGTPSLVLSTGGLPESVHDEDTGWVLNDLTETSIKNWWKGMNSEKYEKISRECYQHTIDSHDLKEWKKLFKTVLGK